MSSSATRSSPRNFCVLFTSPASTSDPSIPNNASNAFGFSKHACNVKRTNSWWKCGTASSCSTRLTSPTSCADMYSLIALENTVFVSLTLNPASPPHTRCIRSAKCGSERYVLHSVCHERTHGAELAQALAASSFTKLGGRISSAIARHVN